MGRARLAGASSAGSSSLVLDARGNVLPVMPWGTVHHVDLTASPAEGAVEIGADAAVVTIVAIGGAVHFELGGDSVAAQTTPTPSPFVAASKYLPADTYIDVPVLPDVTHVAFVAAEGSSATVVQVIERARS